MGEAKEVDGVVPRCQRVESFGEIGLGRVLFDGLVAGVDVEAHRRTVEECVLEVEGGGGAVADDGRDVGFEAGEFAPVEADVEGCGQHGFGVEPQSETELVDGAALAVEGKGEGFLVAVEAVGYLVEES